MIMEPGVFLDFAKLDYKCPHCQKEYYDSADKLCERLNKSAEGWIKLRCTGCRRLFGYTVDMTGRSVGFDFTKE